MSFTTWLLIIGYGWALAAAASVLTYITARKHAAEDYETGYEHGKADEWEAVVSHVDELVEASASSIEVYEPKAVTLEDVSYELFHEFHDKHRVNSKFSTEVAPEDVVEVKDAD